MREHGAVGERHLHVHSGGGVERTLSLFAPCADAIKIGEVVVPEAGVGEKSRKVEFRNLKVFRMK